MDRTALKVGFAVFLGAFIGSLVALQINGYFWWAGLIVGGFVGYISYEFKAVLQAIPRAVKAATAWRAKEETIVALKVFPVFLLTNLVVFLFNALIFFFLFYVGAAILIFDQNIACAIEIATMATMTAGVVAAMFTTVSSQEDAGLAARRFLRYQDMYVLSETKLKCKRDMLRYNTLSILFFWIPYGIIKFVPYIYKKIPAAILGIWKGLRVIGLFFWHLFRLIHSDLRILCMTDAAIFAGVGYFMGNALYGALVGAAFGIFNYVVVSKKILKIAPEKIRQ